MWKAALIVTSLVLADSSRSSKLDEPLDKSGWVDLNDMAGGWRPDAAKEGPTWTNDQPPERPAKTPGKPEAAEAAATEGGHEQKSQVNCTHIKDPQTKPRGDAGSGIFLRRHVRLLADMFDLHDGQAGEFRATLVFDAAAARALADYAAGRGHLADVDAALSTMISNVHVGHADGCAREWTSVLTDVSESLNWLLVAASLFGVFILYLLLSGAPVWKIVCLLLVSSSAWHWTHLYKKAMAKKHAQLVSNDGVPTECLPQASWWPFNWFERSSHRLATCAAHQEALMVDPLWEVSPTMAVADTIVKFVLLPLEHLGEHIGKFFAKLLDELTWLSSPVVLAFVFAVVLLMMVMICGYRLKLPFFLGSFEPRTPRRSTVPITLAEEVKALKLLLEDKETILETRRTEVERLTVAKESAQTRLVSPVKAASTSCLPLTVPRETSSFRESQDLTEPAEVKEKSSTDVTAETAVQEVEASPVDRSSRSVCCGTPAKKLMLVGPATSPDDTGFEWVVEEGEECGDSEPSAVDALVGEDAAEASSSIGVDRNDFLRRIESVFNENEEESDGLGTSESK
jgi:hypothetical protein